MRRTSPSRENRLREDRHLPISGRPLLLRAHLVEAILLGLLARPDPRPVTHPLAGETRSADIHSGAHRRAAAARRDKCIARPIVGLSLSLPSPSLG
jgi:hypothetical protein